MFKNLGNNCKKFFVHLVSKEMYFMPNFVTYVICNIYVIYVTGVPCGMREQRGCKRKG